MNKDSLIKRNGELLELLDDVASLLQNPEHYGLLFLSAPAGSPTFAGIPFREATLAKLAIVSPAHPTGRQGGAAMGQGLRDLYVPTRIVRLANAYLRTLTGQPWPEDDWHTITPDWDLNLYRRATGHKRAAILYAVKNGQTDTTRWRSLL